MFTLIYRSAATIGVDIGEIGKMLDRARISNHIHGITGCLLYHNGCFLQLIEGEEDDVRTLYSKIKNDERHLDVRTLMTEKVHERMFSGWSMLFSNIEDDIEDGGDKLSLFNQLYYGSGIPAMSNRSKFVLWEHVHDIISSEIVEREKLRTG